MHRKFESISKVLLPRVKIPINSRLNNRIQSPEPKNVLVIDLGEYEKELDQQNAKSIERAKLGSYD